MKKISKIFAMLVVALVGLSLTACSDGDDLSTDQYGNDISLQSFGPCPVLRGGTLYLYGTNLDQIESVNLPGADPITAYEILQSGYNSKISIQVPAEKCETGQIVLKTKKGGEITSVSPITYREDIEITKFFVGSEGTMVGNVGDVVTIKGDYLNLMHGVIFAGSDTIKEAEFVGHDRYTIQVKIPAEARTGVITLTDTTKDGTSLETKEELTINTPEATPIKDRTIKAGEILSIKGSSFDQIVSVKFEGATVDAADFKSQSAAEITVAVPAKATDGTFYVVTKSGIEVPVGNIITVVPTELVATPNPVKNGAELTITGKDMDLITGIAFPNAATSELKKVETTKVTATVPEDAQEGDITLSLANGKTVTVAYTLVKPTVASCTPAAITAGEKTIIKGTDLDLVKSITFPGDVEQTVEKFAAQNAQAIAVTVPAACAGTGFKLNLKNGTTIEVKDALSIKAATDPAIASITPGEATAGSTITITGKNFQNIQNLYIGSYKVNRYTSRTNTEIVCQVPANAEVGTYKIVMEDPDGNKIEGPEFKVVPAEKDIATITNNMDNSAIKYPYNFTWDDTGRFRIMKADLIKLGVKVGSKMLFYKEAGATGQVQINNANWGGIDTVADWNGDQNCVVKVFDAAMMEAVNSISDGWSDTAFILQGDMKNVTKIAILP
ncbi:IPT/TIG domain-containing protein [Segatella copri]|uniref:IPT/TIG domain-containing protein n=1 Tax=Segatella copri TaxID=165179 RepID=UPI001C3913B5|nr:IPT/TIG domain-containing protein [Segatella copri]MBV3400876.1 IPT/TIG domain-containing protein [Segatella copri]MBW0047560.1 IPT/TIG domain-containing protein [Segatella copri]